MFGRKRRSLKEAAAKAKADTDLKTTIVDLIGMGKSSQRRPGRRPAGIEVRRTARFCHERRWVVRARRHKSGHWSGRSAGFSVPVTDGIRFRVGKSAGTYVQGEEKPTIIDTGDISFTTQRVVFQGGKYTREWLFSKLVGVVHDANQPCTAIQVSNREKTSGIVYAGLSPEIVRLKLEVAVAIFNGDGPDAGPRATAKAAGPRHDHAANCYHRRLTSGAQTAAASSGPSSSDTQASAGTAATSGPPVAGEPPPVPPPISISGPSVAGARRRCRPLCIRHPTPPAATSCAIGTGRPGPTTSPTMGMSFTSPHLRRRDERCAK